MIIKSRTLLVLFGLTFSLLAKDNSGAGNDSKINQLPASCKNYGTLSDNPYDILPCFASTLGNNRTNQSAIRDAYRQFHALNWPIKGNTVGMPDYAKSYKNQPDNFPVWQSWPTVTQVKNKVITKWNDPSINIPESCHDFFIKKPDNTDTEYEKFIKKYPSVPLGPKIEVLVNDINPQGEIIVDTNGKSARYQVYLNKPAFDYVNELSDMGNIHFPVGNEQASIRGAIYVKATWKILKGNEFENYHKSFAIVTSGDSKDTKACKLEVVGLSALHIISKNNPKNQANGEQSNQWSWASYFFTGSAPTYSSTRTGKLQLTEQNIAPKVGNSWGFFNHKWTELQKKCINVNKEWDQNIKTCPINKNNCEIGDNCESSTIVAYPATQDKENLHTYNEKSKSKLSHSVWRNYEILNNQWLDYGIAAPEILENPILEPFNNNKTSCSKCHHSANEHIFKDYIFSSGLNTQKPINLSTSNKGLK